MKTKTLALTLFTAATVAAPTIAGATEYDAAGMPIPGSNQEPDEMSFYSNGESTFDPGPVLDQLFEDPASWPPNDTGMVMPPPPGEFAWLDHGDGFGCPSVATPDHLTIPIPFTEDTWEPRVPQLRAWCFAHAAAYVGYGEMGAFAFAHGVAEEDWTPTSLLFSAHAHGAVGWEGARVGAHLIVANYLVFSDYQQTQPNQPLLTRNTAQDYIVGSTLKMKKFGVDVSFNYNFDIGAGMAFEVSTRNVKIWGDGHIRAGARVDVAAGVLGTHSTRLTALEDELWMGASAGYRFEPGGVKICANYRVVNDLRRALDGDITIAGERLFNLSPIPPRFDDVTAPPKCTPPLPVW